MNDAVPEAGVERQQRPGWQLAVAYAVTVVLFVLASSLEGQAAAGGLFWAAIARGIYVWFRRRRDQPRPFMSPWFFVLAAVFAVFSLVGQRAREENATDDRAVARNVVAAGAEVTPTDRCVTKVLDQADEMTATQRAAIPAGLSMEDYSRQFCAQAAASGALDSSGDVRATDELMQSTCADGMMKQFEVLPVADRRFSHPDFAKVADRYCAEAIRQGLVEGSRSGANNQELQVVLDNVVAELLESGEIQERP